MNTHVNNSLAAKLFLRFLKDNDLPLNAEAYSKTFFCKCLIKLQLLPQHYLKELREQGLFYDDCARLTSARYRLKWYLLLMENHTALDDDIVYKSPYGLLVSFSIPSIFELKKKQNILRSVLETVTYGNI